MEENDNQEGASFFDLQISESITYSLDQAAKWAKLMAFFASGIMLLCILVLLFAYRNPQAMETGTFTIVAVLILAAFLVIGTLIGLLFNFAEKIKKGLLLQDIEIVEKGMASLKLYFIIAGVLYILSIIIILASLAVTVYNKV